MSASQIVLPRMRCKTAVPRDQNEDNVDDNYANAKNINSQTQTFMQRSSIQFAPCAEMCSVWQREYPLVRYLYHRQPITHLLYSKRAHRYFSAASDGLVKMWKPDYHSLDSQHKPVIVHEKNLLHTRAQILSMTLSPLSVGSAQVLLVMCNDGTITLIQTVNGEVLRTLLGIRTNNINEAKAIYERHSFKPKSKAENNSPSHNNNKGDYKNSETVGKSINRQRQKDTNKHEKLLQTCASSNKTISNKQLSNIANKQRERQLVQMSKLQTRVLPYTIRAYHRDTMQLCFGRSNKYFQGLSIVAPTYEHLIQPVYHIVDLLFDYGKLTTPTKFNYSSTTNINNSSNNKKQARVNNVSISTSHVQQQQYSNKKCQAVHSGQENWFATAIAITYHTSKERHKGDALCNNVINTQHETILSMSSVQPENTYTNCNINTRSKTQSSLLTSGEWKNGVYLFLGFADGLVQAFRLNEKWFSTSHLSSTRVDPPVAFYPVTSLLVHEQGNSHSSLQQSRCNESTITMIVISQSFQQPTSSLTSAKQSNTTKRNNDEVSHDDHHNATNNTTQAADVTFHQLVFIGCKDNSISVRHFDRLHIPLLILGNQSCNIDIKSNLFASFGLNDATDSSRYIQSNVIGGSSSSKSREYNNKMKATQRMQVKTRSRQILGLSGHTKPITCYAWNNLHQLLVTGGKDYMLYFWSPRTSRPVRSIDCRTPHTTDDNIQALVQTKHNSTNTKINSANDAGGKSNNNTIESDNRKNDESDNSDTYCNNSNDNYDNITLQNAFVIYGFPISLSFVTRQTNKTFTNKNKLNLLQNSQGHQIWLLMLDNRHVIRIYDAADGTCLHTLLDNNNKLQTNTLTPSRHRKQKQSQSHNCHTKYNNNNNNTHNGITDSNGSPPADTASQSNLSSNCSSNTYTSSQQQNKQHLVQQVSKWQAKPPNALLSICYDTQFQRLLLGGYCINVWNTIQRVQTTSTAIAANTANIHGQKQNTRLNDKPTHPVCHSESKQYVSQQKQSHQHQSHNGFYHQYQQQQQDQHNVTPPVLVTPLRKRQTQRWITSVHADMNDAMNITLPLPQSAPHLYTTDITQNQTALGNKLHGEDANMTNSSSNTISYKDCTASDNIITTDTNSDSYNDKMKSVNTIINNVFANTSQKKLQQFTITQRFTDETTKPPKSTFASSTPSFNFFSEVDEIDVDKQGKYNLQAHTTNSLSTCHNANYGSVFNTQRVTSANNEQQQRRSSVEDVYRSTNNVMDDFDINATNMTKPYTLATTTTPTISGGAPNSTNNTPRTQLTHVFAKTHQNDDTITDNNYHFNNDNPENDLDIDTDVDDGGNGVKEGAAVVMQNAYLHRRRQEALQQIMRITCDDTDTIKQSIVAKSNLHSKRSQNNKSWSKNKTSATKKSNIHMTLQQRLLRFNIHDSHLRHHSHVKHGRLSKQHRHAGLIKSKMKPYEVRRAIEAGLIHLASFTDFSDTGTSTVFFGAQKELAKDRYRQHTSNAIISQSFVRDALKHRNDRVTTPHVKSHVTKHDSVLQQHKESIEKAPQQSPSTFGQAEKYTSSLNLVAQKWLTSHSLMSSFVQCNTTSDQTAGDTEQQRCKQIDNDDNSKNNNNISINELLTKNKGQRQSYRKDTKEGQSTMQNNEELDWYTRREMAAQRRRRAAALWHPARVMHTLMNWNVQSQPHQQPSYQWQQQQQYQYQVQQQQQQLNKQLPQQQQQQFLQQQQQIDILQEVQHVANASTATIDERNKNKYNHVNHRKLLQVQEQHELAQAREWQQHVAVPVFLPKILNRFSEEQNVKCSTYLERKSCNSNADLQCIKNQILTNVPCWQQINAAQRNRTTGNAVSTHENAALLLAQAEMQRIEQQIQNKYNDKRNLKKWQQQQWQQQEREKSSTHINSAHNNTTSQKHQGDECNSKTMPSILPYKSVKNGKVIRIETFIQLKQRINKKVDLSGGVGKPRTKFHVHYKQ